MHLSTRPIILGSILFWIGYSEDGPGACVLGLAIAFGFIMLSLRNIGVIKKGYYLPLLLSFYGAGILFLSVVLFLDGEFNGVVYPFIISLTLGFLMLFFGIILLLCQKSKSENEIR